MIKTMTIDDQTIVIDIHEKCKVDNYDMNNVSSVDCNGNILWRISDLLQDYSHRNQLNYSSEVYFDIICLEDGLIRCIGFYNHCDIDLNSNKIVRIVNNR